MLSSYSLFSALTTFTAGRRRLVSALAAIASSDKMFDPRSLIAVCQLNSRNDLLENFDAAQSMMEHAQKRQAKMVFFPECFDYIGENREENLSLAVPEDGEYIGRYRNCAKKYGLWLSLGGYHQKDPSGRYPYNTHLIIDDQGEIRGSYRKIHLFDLDIPGKVRLLESEFSSPGNEIPKPVVTPVGNVAMSICYDLRFPELALWYRMNGADILTYPAAFTVDTGLAHWEMLLRARAIETQCYVIAAAQTGKHNDKRSSYGHAMVIDPWGAIVAQCSETVGDKPYTFGEHSIPAENVFYRSAFTYCFVNRSPVLPGHVLVCPVRAVNRLTDLSHAETSDLFITAKRIQAMLESYHKTASSTVCVQDGPDAGQTVSHVHVHILPRKKGDFGGNPDNVYHELAEHDKPGKKVRIRDSSSMQLEAYVYRHLLATGIS